MIKLRQHKNGGWLADIRVRTPEGKVIRERRRSPVASRSATQRWAEARAAELAIHGSARPTEGVKAAPTFSEFKKRFTEGHVEANRLKKGTANAIDSIFRTHLLPHFGAKRLDEIGNEDVQRLKLRLAKRSPKTMNNVLCVLSRMMKAAVEWGLLEKSPCSVKLVKVPPHEMEWYEDEDLNKLLEAARKIGTDAELIVLLGADAGLRAGEMIALEQGDIRRRILTVSRAEYLGEVQSPKSNRSRKIELTSRLERALSQARHLKGPRVLYDEDGHTATTKWLHKRMKAAQRLAGLTVDGRLHVLRHTFCSRLAAAGVPAKAIQRLAGHASLMTTEKYMHLSPNAGSEAIRMLEKFGSRLAPAPKTEGVPLGTPSAS